MSKIKHLIEILKNSEQHSRRFQIVSHNHPEIDEVVKSICNTQPIAPNLFRDLEEAFMKDAKDKLAEKQNQFVRELLDVVPLVPDLLPKHWEPKHEYVEISQGAGRKYKERIIRKDVVRQYIKNGWRITRLSKLSPSLIYKKWVHVIVAMEQHECKD